MSRIFVVHHYDYKIVEIEKTIHFDWLLEFQRKIDNLMKKGFLKRQKKEMNLELKEQND